MNASLVRQVVVLGSGTDALLTAASLKRQLPGLGVTLLRDPAAEAADPIGESTTPAVLQQISRVLGLQGQDIHLRARPVWTLGYKCLWGARGSFFRGFDQTFSQGLNGFRTEPGYLAAATGLDSCSPSIALMAAGKLFPKDGANAFKPLEHLTGMNFRTELLDDLLLKLCQVLGIAVREGRPVAIEQAPQRLVLADGGSLEADLFFDAAGSARPLSTLAGNSGWVSYEDAAPCTRAVTVLRRRGSEPIRPFTTLETQDAGWRWRIEHDDAVGLALAWAPEFMEEEEACAQLLAKADDSSAVTRIHHWNNGRLTSPWQGAVIAVGDAGGFLPPMASLRIGMLLFQVNWLVRLLAETDGRVGDASAASYNTIAAEAWDELRDFHAIHHRYNTASDSPFWTRARETVAPRSCAPLVDLYQSIGPSQLLAQFIPSWPGAIGIDSWIAALLGMGVPFRHQPEIPAPEKKAWESLCEQRRAMAKQAVPAELCIGAARRAMRPEPRAAFP
ncbi:tryptophan 7-halogenase [Luteolibacter sp. GHJ8]|uniref:Tryptophan 7-halogenase n=1 Tax=Luteolibacter rhizosphaerae TaxID=2989719 RepID=A0ABT3G1B6_9BACT|nr:tryptophan 7-halogenase [Luteolibacter rhizosphaerae]MCW1913289.1 tryptophan 7-halogenase [Luteolibacter rhizosphaerae]